MLLADSDATLAYKQRAVNSVGAVLELLSGHIDDYRPQVLRVIDSAADLDCSALWLKFIDALSADSCAESAGNLLANLLQLPCDTGIVDETAVEIAVKIVDKSQLTLK